MLTEQTFALDRHFFVVLPHEPGDLIRQNIMLQCEIAFSLAGFAQ